MMDEQQWASVLAAAAAAPVPDPDAALRAAARLGFDVAPGTAGCSVTQLTDSGFRTTASANDLAVVLDRVQYDAGAGPCLAASATGSVERLDDMVRPTRFEVFRAAAIEHGVGSSMSVGLPTAHRPAALNLYAFAPPAYVSERPRAVADLLARFVAAVLAGRPPADGAELAAARSAGARAARAVALLMASHRLDRAAAFAELVRRSRRQGRSISELTDELLGRAGRQDAP